MRTVADTNILFSFFWKDSFTKQIIMSPNMEIFSPDFAIEELKKHSPLIMNKTRITKGEFSAALSSLKSFVKFFPLKYYGVFMKEAGNISPDKDDSNFLALCLKLNLPLWSNDAELKKQDKVAIIDTKDIIDIYFD
ncbi:MAG: PIN domain-containing protein [Nanoarchaeota archaeon]